MAAPELLPTRSGVPTGPEAPTPYHRLNPLTKLALSGEVAVLAIVAGGVTLPLAAGLALVVVPALVARVLGRLARTALLLSLPVALSAMLVNLFVLPGASGTLFELGPLRATSEGLGLALEVVARVATISGALTLFSLTTRPGELVADLERRGLPARLTFVVSMSVTALPAVLERARMVVAAQRARGLDTQGSLRRRARALVPLAAPTLLGALRDVDARAVGLEARGFGCPGRRTLLWTPTDPLAERVIRWLLVAGLCAYVLARALGVVPRLP